MQKGLPVNLTKMPAMKDNNHIKKAAGLAAFFINLCRLYPNDLERDLAVFILQRLYCYIHSDFYVFNLNFL